MLSTPMPHTGATLGAAWTPATGEVALSRLINTLNDDASEEC